MRANVLHRVEFTIDIEEEYWHEIHFDEVFCAGGYFTHFLQLYRILA